MKKKVFVWLFLLVLPASYAEASWLIDVKQYLVSAHGENSCLDCHESIPGKTLHPDPANVTRKLTDFFSSDQCLLCHETVFDQIAEGSHGKEKVEDAKRYEDCLPCHDPHYQTRIGGVASKTTTIDLSGFSDEDNACLACHGIVESDIAPFCFNCHAHGQSRIQNITAKAVPLIDPNDYRALPHADISCLVCHPQAPGFNHGNQKPGECLQCHPRHDDKVAHAAHSLVSCGACHLKGVQAIRDPKSRRIIWKNPQPQGATLEIHEMVRLVDTAACRRCHVRGNQIGAVSMVLPAKSVLCMPCHAATFSAGDIISRVAFLIFGFGLTMTFSWVLTGSVAGVRNAGALQKILVLLGNAVTSIFSSKIVLMFKTIFFDVLLQRRLYKTSSGRWLIHSLIFLPFAFRFMWGLVALLLSLLAPEWTSIWFLVDKNNPNTAFLFDLTGVMIILGITLAFIRGMRRHFAFSPDLPPQDRLALGLIAGIVAVGFVLKGARIAMTGRPPGAEFAFISYWISLLFSDISGLTELYGYIWYLHALLTGTFVAYLPFSRLVHIIMAPAVLTMTSVAKLNHQKYQYGQ